MNNRGKEEEEKTIYTHNFILSPMNKELNPICIPFFFSVLAFFCTETKKQKVVQSRIELETFCVPYSCKTEIITTRPLDRAVHGALYHHH